MLHHKDRKFTLSPTSRCQLDRILVSSVLPEDHPDAQLSILRKPSLDESIVRSPGLRHKLRRSMSRVSLLPGKRLQRSSCSVLSSHINMEDLLGNAETLEDAYDSDARAVSLKSIALSGSTYVRSRKHTSSEEAPSMSDVKGRHSSHGSVAPLATIPRLRPLPSTKSAPSIHVSQLAQRDAVSMSHPEQNVQAVHISTRAANTHVNVQEVRPQSAVVGAREAMGSNTSDDLDCQPSVAAAVAADARSVSSTHLYDMNISQQLRSLSRPSDVDSETSHRQWLNHAANLNLDSITTNPAQIAITLDPRLEIESMAGADQIESSGVNDGASATSERISLVSPASIKGCEEASNKSTTSLRGLQGLSSDSENCHGIASENLCPYKTSKKRQRYAKLHNKLRNSLRAFWKNGRSHKRRASVLNVFSRHESHSPVDDAKPLTSARIGSELGYDGACDDRTTRGDVGAPHDDVSASTQHLNSLPLRSCPYNELLTVPQQTATASVLSDGSQKSLHEHVAQDDRSTRQGSLLTTSGRHESPEAYERSLTRQGDDRRRKSTLSLRPKSESDEDLPVWLSRPLSRALPLLPTTVSGEQSLMTRALHRHQKEKAALICNPPTIDNTHTHHNEALFGSAISSSFGQATLPGYANEEDVDPLDATPGHIESRRAKSMSQLRQNNAEDPVTPMNHKKRSSLMNTESRSTGRAHIRGTLMPVASWCRFPSHTRQARCGTAGLDDNVITRDFALEAIKDAEQDMSKPKRRLGVRRPSTLHHIWRYYSTLFTSPIAQNRRTSVAVGGKLEHPELEMLPAVFDTFRPAHDLKGSDIESAMAHVGTDDAQTETDGGEEPSLGIAARPTFVVDSPLDTQFRIPNLDGTGGLNTPESPESPAVIYSKTFRDICTADEIESLTAAGREGLLNPALDSTVHATDSDQTVEEAGMAAQARQRELSGLPADVIAVRHFPSVTVIDDRRGHWRSISHLSKGSDQSKRSASIYSVTLQQSNGNFGQEKRTASEQSLSSMLHESRTGTSRSIRDSTRDLLAALERAEAVEREKLMRAASVVAKM